ncbi:ABC transporter permease [Entomospira entomophila]|uniref:ABC transporter permease n=1 Tax=Entomospira entomophila TaxID=2719988 RepID=A0A968GB05_9SPIO|nr:FtsX-like permease family protein [Entomospira entomophilus]NIZ40328.1 ABC transporter permease [Entomospira entomophilus]WDI35887.1 ABC transporter permease [Entomospira entomophilus]
MKIGHLLARRFMRNPKQKAFRSAVIVIALSVAPLVLITQISQAMIQGIIERFIETHSYHLQIHSLFGDFSDTLIEQVRQTPDLQDIYHEIRSYGLAFSSKGRMSVQLRGVTPNLYQDDAGFRKYVSISPTDASLMEGEVWIGLESAKRLGLEVGDVARILITNVDEFGQHKPKIMRATISAIITTGYQNLDESWVFLDEEWAREILDGWQDNSILGIKIDNPYYGLEELRRSLQESIGEHYIVYDWLGLNRNEIVSMNSSQGIILFLVFVIVVVAIANTVGVLQLFYLEQIQSIATLSFLGMGRRELFQLYLYISFWASLSGGLIGIVLGLVFTVMIAFGIPKIEQWSAIVIEWIRSYIPSLQLSAIDLSFYLSGIELNIRWISLVGMLAGIVIGTLLFSLIPAWRTSRLKPMQILRKI